MGKMQKGKITLIRNDDILKVKQRLFKKPNDNTTYVAQVSLQKKSLPSFPRKKEFWIGYYTSTGTQMGLGFFKSKKEVPKEFRAAFAGLDITALKRKRR